MRRSGAAPALPPESKNFVLGRGAVQRLWRFDEIKTPTSPYAPLLDTWLGRGMGGHTEDPVGAIAAPYRQP